MSSFNFAVSVVLVVSFVSVIAVVFNLSRDDPPPEIPPQRLFPRSSEPWRPIDQRNHRHDETIRRHQEAARSSNDFFW